MEDCRGRRFHNCCRASSLEAEELNRASPMQIEIHSAGLNVSPSMREYVEWRFHPLDCFDHSPAAQLILVCPAQKESSAVLAKARVQFDDGAEECTAHGENLQDAVDHVALELMSRAHNRYSSREELYGAPVEAFAHAQNGILGFLGICPIPAL